MDKTHVALEISSCLGGGSRGDREPGRFRESKIRRCIWLSLGFPSSAFSFGKVLIGEFAVSSEFPGGLGVSDRETKLEMEK